MDIKVLVISSCTAKKLDHAAYARDIYTGLQHEYIKDGVDLIRKALGSLSIDWSIISAKYGVLHEHQWIAPYDFTFKGMKKDNIIGHSHDLKIHTVLSHKIHKYDLVFFLVGKEYVQSLELPFPVDKATTQVFLLGSTYKNLIPERHNCHFVPVGIQESKDLSQPSIAVKGYIFYRLAEHIYEAKNKLILPAIQKDPSVMDRYIDMIILDRQDQIKAKEEEQISLL